MNGARYRKNQDYFDYCFRKYYKSDKLPSKVVEEVKQDLYPHNLHTTTCLSTCLIFSNVRE